MCLAVGMVAASKLRRTPLQAGATVRLVNTPVTWSARGLNRALDTVRTTPPALNQLLSRGARAGDVAVKTLTASRDAALETAEQVTRRQGADGVADVLHSARTATGVLEPGELPIDDYDQLNVNQAVAAVKELTEPGDVRVIVAYEEAHKNRHGIVSAAQTRLATIAHEVVGLE